MPRSLLEAVPCISTCLGEDCVEKAHSLTITHEQHTGSHRPGMDRLNVQDLAWKIDSVENAYCTRCPDAKGQTGSRYSVSLASEHKKPGSFLTS